MTLYTVLWETPGQLDVFVDREEAITYYADASDDDAAWVRDSGGDKPMADVPEHDGTSTMWSVGARLAHELYQLRQRCSELADIDLDDVPPRYGSIPAEGEDSVILEYVQTQLADMAKGAE